MTIANLRPGRPGGSALLLIVAMAVVALLLGAKRQPDPSKIGIYDFKKVALHLVAANRGYDRFQGAEGDAKRAEIQKMTAELEAAGETLSEEERATREEAIRMARRDLMEMRPNKKKLQREQRDAAVNVIISFARDRGYSLIYDEEFLRDTHGGLIDLRAMTDITDDVIEKLVDAGLASKVPLRRPKGAKGRYTSEPTN